MSRSFYETLRTALGNGESVLLATIAGGSWDGQSLLAEKAMLHDGEIIPGNPAHAALWAELFAARGDKPLPCMVHAQGLDLLFERMSARPKLTICGGGHIAEPLCRICSLLDFDITLIDDRPEFANAERFPDAARIICAPFAEAMEQLDYNDGDYFVIITRGHKDDRFCLTRILNGRFTYAGMIGSRRKVAVVMQQLKSEGCPEELLARVHAPIGLRIGAQTPAEIAVCIAAELIQVRSGAVGGTLSPDALDALATGKRLVMATIVSKEGSAPRGLGARLIADETGLLSGTVGGGLGEAEVIRLVPEVLASGAPRMVRFNMTNADAGNDGMVCGGVLTVLLESLGASS